MPSFEPGAILLSVVTSGVGFALFMYGRKAHRPPQLVTGLLFMVYPYFVPSTVGMFAVGVALALGLWGALWLGW